MLKTSERTVRNAASARKLGATEQKYEKAAAAAWTDMSVAKQVPSLV